MTSGQRSNYQNAQIAEKIGMEVPYSILNGMSTLSSTPVYVTCPFLSKVFQQFHIQQLCSVLLAVLVLSGNTSISHNFNMLQAQHSSSHTKLGHNNNDHLPFMSHDLQGSKGHTGVTEVKSVILL